MGTMMKRKIKPVHPGRILHDEFMEPAGVSQYRLAQATGLSQVQIGNIVRGKRGITAETALRLERALGMSAQTWMNLQALYDLEKATVEVGRRIKQTTARLNLRDAA
jgi:antitoxin HigA-1